MTAEDIRLQVALSCIQGVLEAKHGFIGEIVPSLAVKESLRIADEFVKLWDKKEDVWQATKAHIKALEDTIKELDDTSERKKLLTEILEQIKSI